MVDKATQDTLGRGIIKQAYIYNTLSKKEVSVIDNLMSVNVYEDIHTPFVYCDMVIIDYDELAKQFPLMGEEYFVFSYKSINGKTVGYHFLLYKNDTAGMTPTNSAKGYVLRGVTLERAFDSVATVAAAYTGSYAKIAGQIFDDYMKQHTGGLDFDYEPSKSIARYVVPQISPMKAIEFCRARSISTSEAKSPFVFFRNSDSYTFMSLNGLFNKSAAQPSAGITHRYAGKSQSAEYTDGDGARVDIVAFDIASYYDTMAKIDEGAYNTHTYSFDLLTKSFVFRKAFNLTDIKNKFQLGGGGVYNRDSFIRNFDDSRCVAYYVPTNSAWEINGTTSTQKDFYPDHAGEMAAYLNLVSEYNIHYTIYGDSDVTAGQVMKIAVPMSRESSQKGSLHKLDPMYSGSFLCARVKHAFTFNENVDYFVRISAINGARNVNIEDIPNG